jgi:hypothetical protein
MKFQLTQLKSELGNEYYNRPIGLSRGFSGIVDAPRHVPPNCNGLFRPIKMVTMSQKEFQRVKVIENACGN